MKQKARASSAIATRVIAAVILAIVLAAGCCALYFIAKQMKTESAAAFSLECGGEKIQTYESEADYHVGEAITFRVNYEDKDAGLHDYKVGILPNPSIKFDYLVGEDLYPWGDISDLANEFSLIKEADRFSFTVPAFLAGILALRYPGEKITAPTEQELGNARLYRLVVSSYDGKVNYTISFKIIPFEVRLDHKEQLFP